MLGGIPPNASPPMVNGTKQQTPQLERDDQGHRNSPQLPGTNAGGLAVLGGIPPNASPPMVNGNEQQTPQLERDDQGHRNSPQLAGTSAAGSAMSRQPRHRDVGALELPVLNPPGMQPPNPKRKKPSNSTSQQFVPKQTLYILNPETPKFAVVIEEEHEPPYDPLVKLEKIRSSMKVLGAEIDKTGQCPEKIRSVKLFPLCSSLPPLAKDPTHVGRYYGSDDNSMGQYSSWESSEEEQQQAEGPGDEEDGEQQFDESDNEQPAQNALNADDMQLADPPQNLSEQPEMNRVAEPQGNLPGREQLVPNGAPQQNRPEQPQLIRPNLQLPPEPRLQQNAQQLNQMGPDQQHGAQPQPNVVQIPQQNGLGAPRQIPPGVPVPNPLGAPLRNPLGAPMPGPRPHSLRAAAPNPYGMAQQTPPGFRLLQGAPRQNFFGAPQPMPPGMPYPAAPQQQYAGMQQQNVFGVPNPNPLGAPQQNFLRAPRQIPHGAFVAVPLPNPYGKPQRILRRLPTPPGQDPGPSIPFNYVKPGLEGYRILHSPVWPDDRSPRSHNLDCAWCQMCQLVLLMPPPVPEIKCPRCQTLMLNTLPHWALIAQLSCCRQELHHVRCVNNRSNNSKVVWLCKYCSEFCLVTEDYQSFNGGKVFWSERITAKQKRELQIKEQKEEMAKCAREWEDRRQNKK